MLDFLRASRADRLVAFDGEGHRGDGILATIATEAITMPLGIQCHNGAISDWLLALGTAACEHILKVLLAIDLTIAFVEWTICQGLLAGAITDKATLVPVASKGTNGSLQDGFTAAGTGARVALDKAFAADWFTFLYIECGVLYLLIAMAAQKMLRMPGLAQGSDDALGDRLIAFVANVVLLFGHTFFFIFFLFLCVCVSYYRRALVFSFTLFHSFFQNTRTRCRGQQ